ncbi:hypothetical protein MA16_Dca004535 [Dendrobium catenatum]|uniref:Uncharacterized protein n=1 Tax=Dendrobium catenatum TaxID=906689 RepID=A0A2I0W7Q7_9ASPA|nr:hypothetical protein MA16_Dca004535 [Dendrobium catenatum]
MGLSPTGLLISDGLAITCSFIGLAPCCKSCEFPSSASSMPVGELECPPNSSISSSELSNSSLELHSIDYADVGHTVLDGCTDIILESSCFELPSCLEDKDESKCLRFDKLNENHESSAEFHDLKRLCAKTGTKNTIEAGLDLSARQMNFPDSCIYRENTSLSNQHVQLEQLKVPELKASMLKDDLVSHLENCISEQIASSNPVFSADCLLNKETLEEWADYFLTDSQSFF